MTKRKPFTDADVWAVIEEEYPVLPAPVEGVDVLPEEYAKRYGIKLATACTRLDALVSKEKMIKVKVLVRGPKQARERTAYRLAARNVHGKARSKEVPGGASTG